MRTGKDVDQQKCSDRLGASNLKKTPPRDLTLLLLMMMMRDGVWWLPARRLQIGGFDWRWPGVDVVKCRRRAARSLLNDSREKTTACYWRKETAAGCDSLKRKTSRLSRETAKTACDFQDMWRKIALISEHEGRQHAGYQRSSHGYPFLQDSVTVLSGTSHD